MILVNGVLYEDVDKMDVLDGIWCASTITLPSGVELCTAKIVKGKVKVTVTNYNGTYKAYTQKGCAILLTGISA